MPRATTKAASLADGPTLTSTRDYWILHLRSEGKSERTISTYLRALVEEDEIERTPMERMRAPSVPLNPPPVLSDDQSALLLAACRGADLIARRDMAMLAVLPICSLRFAVILDIVTVHGNSQNNNRTWLGR